MSVCKRDRYRDCRETEREREEAETSVLRRGEERATTGIQRDRGSMVVDEKKRMARQTDFKRSRERGWRRETRKK